MVLRPDPIALWAIPVGDLGGVARHAVDVARTGVPGWRLVFLTPPGEVVAALKDAGAAVLSQPFGPAHGLRASVGTLRHTIRTLRPRIVHTHLAHADLVAAAGAPLRGGPALVSTEHGIARDDLVYHHSTARSRLMAAAHTARVRRFAALIAVSQATADAMRDKWHPGRAIRVIPNGVDPRPEATRRPGLRVLSLARFAPEKRLDVLVDAFALLRRAHPQATLTLAGVGELRDDVERRVGRLDLAGSVSLPGYVDAAQAMAGHDVLAMLSVWENCSYALLDAVSAGLGVVATPVGGNPEILPGRSLRPADPPLVAEALAQQGLDLGSRPIMRDWPSVAEMTARIADVYAEVTR